MEVTALELIDLTTAQKLDRKSYPNDCVVAFSRDLKGCPRGERAKLIPVTATRLILEMSARIRHVSRARFDYSNVCRIRPLTLSAGDRLQRKMNGLSSDGRKLANGRP